jgi:PAS domain S-box-containing protein
MPAQRPKRLWNRLAEEQYEIRDRALATTAEGIAIADARQPDFPLVYVNSGFERLTGYSASEVLGHNCRFLQGPGTDQATLDKLRAAMRERRECTIQVLNYRKDGSTFWNRLSITPIRDSSGAVTHLIGVQSDVTEQKLAEEALEAARQRLEEANRSLRKDLEAAAKIQQSLLPTVLPNVPGANFAWSFRPCSELAGDILNIFAMDNESVGLYVLDVSGHGVAAALLSVTVSRLLSPIPGQSFLYEPAPDPSGRYPLAQPAEVLKRLNRQFPFDPRTAQYFTIFYGRLDIKTGELYYCSAGHPGPVYVPCGGQPRTLTSGGVPVGLFPNPPYETHLLCLEPGDRLYVATDGILETENAEGQEFGLERLLDVLHRSSGLPLEKSLDALTAHVQQWCGCSSLADDATMLAVERSRSEGPATSDSQLMAPGQPGFP